MASQQQWIPVTCPKCATPQKVHAYCSLDVKEEPELKEKLYKGDLNVFDCIECGKKLHFDPYLLYSDRHQGVLLSVYSPDYADRFDDLAKGICRELLNLGVDEMAATLILFGYPALARVVALVDGELKGRKPAELADWTPDNYRRLYVYAQEFITTRSDPDYEKKLPDIETAFKTALSHQQSGDAQKAADLYEDILKTLPDYFPAAFNSGLLYFGELDNLDRALDRFLTCRRLRPNDSEVNFGLGQIYLKLQSPEKAVPCFERAVVSTPFNTLAWFNQGLGLAMLGEKEAGLDSLERSLELTQNNDERNLIGRTIRRIMDKM